MQTIYGPSHWNAREAAEETVEYSDLARSIERGRDLWSELGWQPHTDGFWDVVEPLMLALAAERPEEIDFGPGFSAATACEELMHIIAVYREQGELP